MSVTLDDVRLARKRAYDRVDYWLQKYQGVTIHEAGISIPRIPKDLHPSEYGDWYDYFEGFTGAEEHGGTEDYVFDEYEPPDLDPEYHPEPEPEPIPEPEPEPIEEFPDEPWWYVYVEDEEDEPEPSEPEPSEDEQTAPDPVDLEAEIRDNAYGIDHEAGDLIGEALDSIREQFENIGDMDRYQSGLEDVLDDSYLWDSLQRANKYKKYANGATDEGNKRVQASNNEVNHALQKLYKHFGMTYYREY